MYTSRDSLAGVVQVSSKEKDILHTERKPTSSVKAEQSGGSRVPTLSGAGDPKGTLTSAEGSSRDKRQDDLENVPPIQRRRSSRTRRNSSINYATFSRTGLRSSEDSTQNLEDETRQPGQTRVTEDVVSDSH